MNYKPVVALSSESPTSAALDLRLPVALRPNSSLPAPYTRATQPDLAKKRTFSIPLFWMVACLDESLQLSKSPLTSRLTSQSTKMVLIGRQASSI